MVTRKQEEKGGRKFGSVGDCVIKKGWIEEEKEANE
jgi:hypothetical protein